MNKNYHLKQTWDTKYNETNCQRYEWIQSDTIAYNIIKSLLPQDKSSSTILQLGYGTSNLAKIINKAGYKNISCVDFSKRLIKKKQKHPQINYFCQDFTQKWKFQPQVKYDIIIDKGSIDCVFCDENYLKKVLTCVGECYKRLKSGGKLVNFSLGLPKNRVYWFRNKLTPFKQVQVRKQVNKSRQQLRKKGKNYNKDKQDNSEDYFVYICTKGNENEDQNNNQDENNMEGVNFDNQQDQNDNRQQNNNQQQQNQQDQNDNNNNKDEQQQNNQNNNDDEENNKEEGDQDNYQNQFDQVQDNQ